MKLWSGRFSKNTDKTVDDFNSSIRFDSRMVRQDIKGSMAHAEMLGKCNVISEEDARLIVNTLTEILDDIENDKVSFDPKAEDIHMYVEQMLIERIGDIGKKLHTGRSRNDQVALDIRLYLKDECRLIKNMIVGLMDTVLKTAKDHVKTIMPGYTHLQRAQPITFGHHMMAYFQMFQRDTERLDDCVKRMDQMPLGSGALAATTYPLDRYYVAQKLGFSDITRNSMDGVSDRDFVIELASVLSIFMMHISRMSEEIILWASKEFSFIELDDAYSTGSSIMPQKKNPDVAELARGKTGRMYGNLMTLLSVMKSLPLAYNKDMQEDKEAIFDSIDTVKMCIPAFTGMLSTMKVNKKNMLDATGAGFTNATDLADYLTVKGISFRNAHEITGKLVGYCVEKGLRIEELDLDVLKSFSVLIEEDIYEAIRPETCVNRRNIPGGPAYEAVMETIREAEQYLKKIHDY
ncbi:MAG TPA: argininosuccinate lyase [Clostridiales bacterium]|nr:argininosuccinate lyase [Clostridiales bacterium]